MANKKPSAATLKRRAAALLKTQKAAFLAGLRDEHTVSHAAERAGVHRQRCYEWRAADPVFAEAWSDVEMRSTELLEREAYRRAAVGTEKPVYQGGELVGTVREFSDVLLMFLLKARRPSTYRENHRIEVGGVDGQAIAAEILTVDAKEASDAAHEFLARLAGPQS
jgi:hypothetical protein